MVEGPAGSAPWEGVPPGPGRGVPRGEHGAKQCRPHVLGSSGRTCVYLPFREPSPFPATSSWKIFLFSFSNVFIEILFNESMCSG